MNVVVDFMNMYMYLPCLLFQQYSLTTISTQISFFDERVSAKIRVYLCSLYALTSFTVDVRGGITDDVTMTRRRRRFD